MAETVPISTTVTSSNAATTSSFQCEQCDYTSNTEHGVNVHKGHQHKNSKNSEELRGESHNNSLNYFLPSEEREENTSASNHIMKNSTVNRALSCRHLWLTLEKDLAGPKARLIMVECFPAERRGCGATPE